MWLIEFFRFIKIYFFVDGYGYFIMEKMLSYKKIFGKGGVIIKLFNKPETRGGFIIKLFNKPETKDMRQNPLLLAVLQQTYM